MTKKNLMNFLTTFYLMKEEINVYSKYRLFYAIFLVISLAFFISANFVAFSKWLKIMVSIISIILTVIWIILTLKEHKEKKTTDEK